MDIERFSRKDYKYIVYDNDLADLRKELLGNAMTRQMHDTDLVLTIYFDTDDFALIRKCIDDPKNKEKIRFRSYGILDDGACGKLEIKRKTRGVVDKRRIGITEEGAFAAISGESIIDGDFGDMLKDIVRGYPGLKPKALISYRRESYSSSEPGSDLRVTIDSDVRYAFGDGISLHNPPSGTHLLSPKKHIVEIKTASDEPGWLAEFFKSRSIKQCGYSKYAKACRKTVLNNRLS